MKVRVLCFAILRDIIGEKEVEIELKEGASVADLIFKLAGLYPQIRKIEQSLMISVNQEYTSRDMILKELDEVAFIPPVSGGM